MKLSTRERGQIGVLKVQLINIKINKDFVHIFMSTV
jgi:hypothetical protein